MALSVGELEMRKEVAARFSDCVGRLSPKLLDHLISVCSTPSTGSSKDMSIDMVGQDESKLSRENTELSVVSIVSKAIEQVFVGVLSLRAALYVWDQCILIGFKKVIVPFAACSIALLESNLLECSNPQVKISKED